MIVEIAVATNTAPADWAGEPDEVLATVVDIFRVRAAAVEQESRRRRRG